MTLEEKVRENWELITATEDEFSTIPIEEAIDRIIQTHCPGDSIFEEIFSDAEVGECLMNCAEQRGMSARDICSKHWKGEI